jgi:hypothetical protein
MKEHLKKDSKVVMEFNILKMEINIKENIYKENFTVKVNIFGLINLPTKDSLPME